MGHESLRLQRSTISVLGQYPSAALTVQLTMTGLTGCHLKAAVPLQPFKDVGKSNFI
jgi:hypothetical protein